ncbi:hypothetical protein BC939DRAFT_467618 [Gamsiella multidivaricata]|uniref:uncharacterized protein n=1 Tax=Gamsiella multidivaricata TaxID=101098 RepID=UPI00221F78C2|nr:uncharacterized protein BC939DRAFT_467618 [Gamsiella multidivaricata]KAI7816876.1 hypothetical protein BC939DRAFT_467618 [Gamsiella multidivaricata]
MDHKDHENTASKISEPNHQLSETNKSVSSWRWRICQYLCTHGQKKIKNIVPRRAIHSRYTCHPCAGAMLIFSVSFHF